MSFMWGSAVSVLEVITINIVLSGDNAVVIALVVRNLPMHQQRPALILGGCSALLIQLAFTLTVLSLLCLPGLRLVGALLLAVVACRILRDEEQAVVLNKSPGNLGSAIVRIA